MKSADGVVGFVQAKSANKNIVASDLRDAGDDSRMLGTNFSSSSSSQSRIIGNVQEEIKYWENSVVYYISSANPTIQVIDGFVRRIWKDLEIDKVHMNDLLFDKIPFIVKPWSSFISYEKASLTRIPVWVKLPKLDIRYWTEDMLCVIVPYSKLIMLLLLSVGLCWLGYW